MGTRIYAQIIYTEEHPGFSTEGYAVMNRAMEQVYRKVLHPDTEVDVHFVDRSTFYTSHVYLEMLNNVGLVEGIIRGEEQGYDVAFIRCGNDPAVREARETVAMPVVGITEAAMHLACQLGSKFAVIGVDAKSQPIVERNIRLFGLESRAIAYRPVRMPTRADWMETLMQGPRWFSDMDFVRDAVAPAFDEVARQCIDDGAEVIVTGCAMYAAFTLAGHNQVSGTVVPIVESVAVGMKQAEMLGDLRRTLGISTSKHLTYQTYLTQEMRDGLTAPFTAQPVGA